MADFNENAGIELSTLSPLGYETNRENLSSLAWSFDGEYIAYVSNVFSVERYHNIGPTCLYFQSIKVGNVKQIDPHLEILVAPCWSPDDKIIFITGYGGSLGPSIYKIDTQSGKTTMVLQKTGINYFVHGVLSDGKNLILSCENVQDQTKFLVMHDLETN